MPAVTVDDILVLTRIPEPDPAVAERGSRSRLMAFSVTSNELADIPIAAIQGCNQPPAAIGTSNEVHTLVSVGPYQLR